MFLLVISEILRRFANVLTADSNFLFRNSEKLQHLFHMQLSKKEKTFYKFFAPFLKSISNFEYFEKTDDPHSLWISEITDREKRG